MAKYQFIPKQYALKPCTKKELCELMELSNHILTKWLKHLQPDLGEPIGGQYSVKQVQLMIEKYGLPGEIIGETN